jgi:hypothetical protein
MFGIIDSNSASLRPGRGRRGGVVESRPYDGSKVTQADTCHCVHCSMSWLYVKGSGRLTGWCFRCNGMLCGQAHCIARGCVPKERWLDLLEAGIPGELINESHVKVSVSVPGSIILG